jgi:hypothetical protein
MNGNSDNLPDAGIAVKKHPKDEYPNMENTDDLILDMKGVFSRN